MIWLILAAGLLDFLANWAAAHWLIPVGPFLVPAGTAFFTVSFTLTDYLRRFHGRRATVAAMLLGFLASVAYTLAFGGAVGRIAVAGLAALACSSTLDYLVQTRTLRLQVWRYVLTSNGVSLLVDSLVFTAVAFAGLPLGARAQIAVGQYLAKLATTAASVPAVYWARRARPVPTNAVPAVA